MKRLARSCITAAMLLLALPVTGQTAAPPAAGGDIIVNMRDVDIANVAEQISRLTGRTLILDPSVKGTVNVTSAEPLTASGVWELFQSVLRVNGFAAVRSGRAWRIVPQASAAREPSNGPVSGQQVVTRMIRLKNLSPETAARVFKPLVAGFGSVEPVTSPKAIVVTDYADNVRRIEQLARGLDSGGGNAFDSITLRYATARDVAAAIQSLGGEAGEGGGTRVAADERSNVVLVRGDARGLEEARRVARVLDQPGGATPTTKVFRLKNNDAESVTDLLKGLVGGEGQANNPVARTLSDTGTGGSSFSGGTNGLTTNSNTPATGISALTGGSGAAQSPFAGSLSRSGGFGNTGSGGGSGGGKSSGFLADGLAVQASPELNAIVVRGTPAAIAAIEPLILELDVRRPQVMIEAAIVEITGDRAEQLGFQLGFGAAAAGVTNSAASSFSNIGIPLSSILSVLGVPAAVGVGSDGFTGNFGSRGDFSVLIQALGQSSRANLLSTPSITTLDNQAAEIVVGQNVPFRTGSFSTDGNTLTPFTTIQRQDVGITLKVVPRVHEGDVVRLDVSQEVSSLVGSVAGASDLITNRRAIQTTVLADDGQTIVLGGLISDDRIRTRSQVPVLGDIPVIGELFKSRREEATRRTLFVFLRPTILRDKAAIAAIAAAKYAQVRGAEAALSDTGSLLLSPPRARLPLEIDGIY